MNCYACSNEAVRQCKRCSRVFCEDHGGEFCAECLRPAAALPSVNLYRGTLLALLVGTAVVVWLLVQPPVTSSEKTDVTGVPVTSTPQVAAQVNKTPFATVIPSAQAATPSDVTPIATATAGAEASPESGSPTAEATRVKEPLKYTVEDGDTLIGIAQQFAPQGSDIMEFAEKIAAANGMDVDDPLSVGQTLTIQR